MNYIEIIEHLVYYLMKRLIILNNLRLKIKGLRWKIFQGSCENLINLTYVLVNYSESLN